MCDFEIEGKPVGKGRPRFKRMGNFVQTYTPEKTADYEKLVRLRFQNAGGVITEKPVRIKIVACFAPPKSTRKRDKAKVFVHIEEIEIGGDFDALAS